jgi:hypothetical protein
MPFTIAHAAAVLPLRKTHSRLPLAALMAGSMSPDFAYFLPGGLNRASSHDLEGIVLFCLPAGLAVWLLFVRLLERPTIELLPEAWRARVPRSDQGLTPRALLFASLAVVLGALTHVAWDAFTHANTPITAAFPGLNARLSIVDGRPIPVYRLLQYLSSVIGLLALAWWGWSLRRAPLPVRVAAESASSLSDRARIIALVAVITSSGVSALYGYASSLHGPFQARVFHLLIGGMTGWALAWMAVALWINSRPPAPRRRS